MLNLFCASDMLNSANAAGGLCYGLQLLSLHPYGNPSLVHSVWRPLGFAQSQDHSRHRHDPVHMNTVGGCVSVHCSTVDVMVAQIQGPPGHGAVYRFQVSQSLLLWWYGQIVPMEYGVCKKTSGRHLCTTWSYLYWWVWG